MKTLFLILGLFITVGVFGQLPVNQDKHEFINYKLKFGTRRVVATIDTICADSNYVYMSVFNASGNTNNIQFKGEYGSWMRLPTSMTANFGDGINFIDTVFIKSTSSADTACIVSQRKK